MYNIWLKSAVSRAMAWKYTFHEGVSTISSLQTNTDTFANSADPDEPSHPGLHYLPLCCLFLTETPICNNESVQIQTWESSC